MQSSNKIPLGQIEEITKDKIGLDQVDNTSDVDKPISSATQAALDDKLEVGDVSGFEATANKAIDFSVVNDIKYPTVKAVQGVVDELVKFFEWALDFLIEQEFNTFSPYENFTIESIEDINGSPVTAIVVNGSPFNFGDPINKGDSFKVEVDQPSVILLKCVVL